MISQVNNQFKPWVLVACGIALFFSSDPVFAQKKSRFRSGTEVRSAKPRKLPKVEGHNVVREEGKIVAYKKRSAVDLDDTLLEGEVRNPSEFYFVHRPEEKFGSLVKKRKNFHKEMLRDTVMIR
ncbi:MAG: hypothetical protein AB1540_10190 [Bdellovibrionota bacterium]